MKPLKTQKGLHPYRFRDCGLDNVFLLNGFNFQTTPYGEAMSFNNLNELHRAIARHLVNDKPKLNGHEFRFIRKEMNMTQKMLGDKIGISEQTIALWEKDKVAIQGYGDLLIRLLYKEWVGENIQLSKLADHLNSIETQGYGSDMYFKETKSNWKLVKTVDSFLKIKKLSDIAKSTDIKASTTLSSLP